MWPAAGCARPPLHTRIRRLGDDRHMATPYIAAWRRVGLEKSFSRTERSER